ncbi:pro-melanin-concentrating hormone, like [Lampris incognitus]|uniref:pro-melanin-concentrating hormone, like n=1 Tax=Lampris incognitus TaxID=2546036 RepID=UPI0024B5D2FB|nr:pro-melanin-concentrating hormone, like [Lampris incognitus]
MRHSAISILFAAALLFECYSLSVAIPMSKTEDGSLEEDTFNSLLSEEAAGNDFRGAEPAIVSNNEAPKVIVVADASLWRNLRMLDRGLPLYKQRAVESRLTFDRRDADQDPSFTVIKKDTMRCMVGRVYRPCWEV